MLDVAEHVFQLIAHQLKTQNISVAKAFLEKCENIGEFEDQ